MRGRGVSVARRSSSSTGVKQHMRSAVRPWAPQLELYLSLRGQLETVLRNGGAQSVVTHPLEAVPLAGRHAERGMEIEAVAVRVAKYRPSAAHPVKCGGSGPDLSEDSTLGPLASDSRRGIRRRERDSNRFRKSRIHSGLRVNHAGSPNTLLT